MERLDAHEVRDGPADLPTRKFAQSVGVEFLPYVSAECLVAADSDCARLLRMPAPIVPAFLHARHDPPTFLVGPRRDGHAHLPSLGCQSADVRSRFRIIPHKQLRKALMARTEQLLARNAVHGLSDMLPQFSAKTIVSTTQAVLFTAAVIGFILLLFNHSDFALGLVRISATLAFFASTVLRLLAVAQFKEPGRQAISGLSGDEPCYTILVPLRDEAAIVPQLLTALGRIAWPRDRLEIKLICEADDRTTIEAIRAHGLYDYAELIEVPPCEPRTKPKALRYALQVSRGDFIVLYDAEDIPHPYQLLEAWRRFAAAGPELACLQAPLKISNAKAGWIARMFALEYDGLFRCLLPWLAQRNFVLPLGGTSNHFRRSALEQVGAWDPHNVTEDADLGIRLARCGYRCDVISLPTAEEAPERLAVWLPQRTRWYKGWIQTWLVHMRRPADFAADIGVRSFAISQVLLFGIVVAALVHPILLLTMANLVWSLASGFRAGVLDAAMLGLDIFNIICGYAGFLAVGLIASRRRTLREHLKILAATPVYWLMISVAAWMALFELRFRPFRWNKTPHRPMRRSACRSSAES